MCFYQMNDIMLYTYPQQDGKYRLKNTLSLSGMKVDALLPFMTVNLQLSIFSGLTVMCICPPHTHR